MIIASGEDQKEKSKRLGIQTIILSVIGLVAVLVFVSLGTVTAANVTAEGTAPITSFFGSIVFYAIALVGFLSCTLTSITFAVYQRKLNGNKIGNISLIISLVSLAICLIFTIALIFIML